MNVDTSSTHTLSPWDEAFVRVESYLHAHQIESRLVLSQLASSIIDEARGLAVEQPDEPPVRLAMEVVHRRMGEWFGKTLEEGNWTEEQFRARGRLALVMTNMSNSWADGFLSNDRISPQLVERLKDSTLQAGPEMRLSKMPPAPLEFAFGDGEDSPESVSRWSAFPALLITALVAGAVGAAWATTR